MCSKISQYLSQNIENFVPKYHKLCVKYCVIFVIVVVVAAVDVTVFYKTMKVTLVDIS